MLREHFIDVVLHYATSQKAEMLWQEIEACYHEHPRHYHTLGHLNSMLRELLPHQASFSNWHTIVFALVYHDAVYKSTKSNNEEKSAQLAEKRLAEITFPKAERACCVNFILATKKHLPADEETNLFTDADLSILGAAPDVYNVYVKQIRREYSLYPDFIYKPGRRKVLSHFLAMDKIYKTPSFQNRYEAQAKINLTAELQVGV